MENNLAKEEVNLPDGEYNGLWSAYHLDILPPPVLVDLTVGVRGINCKVKVTVRIQRLDIYTNIKRITYGKTDY